MFKYDDSIYVNFFFCLFYFSSTPAYITFRSGSLDWTTGGSIHTVSRIIMHEDYNSADSWVNDIAVIEVKFTRIHD